MYVQKYGEKITFIIHLPQTLSCNQVTWNIKIEKIIVEKILCFWNISTTVAYALTLSMTPPWELATQLKHWTLAAMTFSCSWSGVQCYNILTLE